MIDEIAKVEMGYRRTASSIKLGVQIIRYALVGVATRCMYIRRFVN